MDRRVITRREFVTAGAGAAALLVGGRTLDALAAVGADPRIKALDKVVRGPIITPGDPRYANARLAFNTRYDAIHPLAVVQPLDVKDVQAVVNWARATGVRIAARSGGHSYAGYSTSPGVVLDLSRLRGVALDGASRAVVGPGARLGAVYEALGAKGKAISGGTGATVGVGGLVLGGGFGLASRSWGLASDNLVSVQIVTADGKVLVADAGHHADLFWACRGGGGGNFGVATRFVLKTHAVSSGSWFVATFPWAETEAVLAQFLSWAPHAPDALGSICRLAAGPGGPTIQVFGQYLGTEVALKSLLAGLQGGVVPTKLVTGTAPWLDLVRRWAGCLGKPLATCPAPRTSFAAGSAYFDRVPTSAQLTPFRQAIEARGSQSGAILVDAYGGAVGRVAPAATAFPHRHELASVQVFAVGPATPTRAWVKATRAAVKPAVSGGAYVNYIDPDLKDWQRAYYGANLARLEKVKRRYDPKNLFRFAQSIPRAKP